MFSEFDPSLVLYGKNMCPKMWVHSKTVGVGAGRV